jgi:type I restriction enzyme, R subunit
VQLKSASQSLESSQQLADLVAQEKESYETLALQMDVEAKLYKEMAFEQEAALNKAQRAFDAQLKELQEKLDAKQVTQVKQSTQTATKQLVRSEDLTCILIDQQLMEAGRDADSVKLKYSKGVRPELGKNRAIAKWPTLEGPAGHTTCCSWGYCLSRLSRQTSKARAWPIRSSRRSATRGA